MTNTENGMTPAMKLIAFLFTVGVAVVASVIGIEARIEAAVAQEKADRQEAVRALEDRLGARLGRIEAKLDAVLLNQNLRGDYRGEQ